MICREGMGRLDMRIAIIGRNWQGERSTGRGLGDDGVEAVRRVLAHSFQLRMPLGGAIEEDTRQIIDLSEAQYGVLDELARNRRVLVTGGAGTGKTLLALEKAKELARDRAIRGRIEPAHGPFRVGQRGRARPRGLGASGPRGRAC